MFEKALLKAKETAINNESKVLSIFVSWKYPFGSSEGKMLPSTRDTHIYTMKLNLQTPVVLLSTGTLKPSVD